MTGLGKRLKGGLLLLAAFAGLGQPLPLAAQKTSEATAPAAAARPAAPRFPRPAIWLIEDEDTKIYLFGTVHVFPASLQWRSPALNRIIEEADELVMETAEASAAEMAGSDEMAMMQLGKSVPILERVSPAARPALRAALDATSMPMEFFDQLHTWAVAFILTGLQIGQSFGEDGQPTALSGAEEVLGQLFRRSKRPISGVETAEEQLGVFATMPQGAQRRFLESTVTGGDADEPEQDLSGEKWAQGDVESIEREMRSLPPELYEPLLTRRNRNWTAWLVRRMQRPGKVLFAVGAGHLAGADSVQTMLAARGIQARRID